MTHPKTWQRATRHMDVFELGLFLGYPTCCTAFFSKILFGEIDHADVYPNGFKLFGSGFVPCPTCNATKTEDDLIATINANRTWHVPFDKPNPN